MALSRKAPRRTWLCETLLSSGSLAAPPTGQDSGPASLGSRLVQDVAADVSLSSRAGSRSVSAHSAAIRARPALEVRELECPWVEGKREKRGRKRQRKPCTSAQLSKDWLLLLAPGDASEMSKVLGVCTPWECSLQGMGCISPTSLLSDPCAMSVLCSCTQLPAGTHGSEGAA